jgi:hypothetical protein
MENQISPLLKIPVEVRLLIYAFLVEDIQTYALSTSIYVGLLYSCKVIKSEMEPELCKEFTKIIEHIQENLRERGEAMRFVPPKTYEEMRNLTIERPQGQSMFMKRDPGLWVSYLRFHTITMKTYDPCSSHPDQAEAASTPTGEGEEQQNIRLLAKHIGRYDGWEDIPRFKRLVYDFSSSPQTANEILLRDARNTLYSNSSWRLLVGRDHQGMVISATFERR